MNYSLKERTSGHVSPTKNQRSFAKYILPDDNSYCNDYMVSCNRYQAQNESYGLVTNITSNPCIFHTKTRNPYLRIFMLSLYVTACSNTSE